MYMKGCDNMYHGKPLFRNGAEVLWEFPNGQIGVISLNDAVYLSKLAKGEIEASKKYIDVIR